MRTGRSGWLDDVGTPQTETLTDVVEKSLRQALTDLRSRFGADVKRWDWGRLHTLTFRHPLGERKPLDRLFDLGPHPTSGSHLTVDKKQYDYNRPFTVREGVSQRMIVDLANPAVALHVLPTGESGLLGNAHSSDQIDLYLEGRYHPELVDPLRYRTSSRGNARVETPLRTRALTRRLGGISELLIAICSEFVM